MEGYSERLERITLALERSASATERIAEALEKGGVEVTPPSGETPEEEPPVAEMLEGRVQNTGDNGKYVLREIKRYNKSGHPIMRIPDENRIKYEEGEKIWVYKQRIQADGGRYYRVVLGSAIELYIGEAFVKVL